MYLSQHLDCKQMSHSPLALLSDEHLRQSVASKERLSDFVLSCTLLEIMHFGIFEGNGGGGGGLKHGGLFSGIQPSVRIKIDSDKVSLIKGKQKLIYDPNI